MIVDERIKAVKNRIAARSFFIIYILLVIDLLYRVLYMKQSPGYYWDIFMMWFVSSSYYAITAYSSGIMSDLFRKGQLKIFIPIFIPCYVISAIATSFILGRTTLNELAGVMISLVLSAPILISIFLFYKYLNRRWEKKNEMEELE